MEKSDNAKAIAALRKCEESIFRRVESYVIIAPRPTDYEINVAGIDPLKYGKIKVAFPREGQGTLHVFVWDCTSNTVQHGYSRGFGYDKLSAALNELKFDNIVFNDESYNWRRQLEDAGYTVIQAI